MPPAGHLGPPPRPRRAASCHPTARQAGIVRAFKKAWEARDIGALIGLLDPGATVTGDIGDLPAALPGRIQGAEQIARTSLAVASLVPGMTLLERTVNGQPGLVAQQDGVTMAVYAFEIAGEKITRIWAILDPASSGPGPRPDAPPHTDGPRPATATPASRPSNTDT